MSVPTSVSVLALLTQARLGELARGLSVSIPSSGRKDVQIACCSSHAVAMAGAQGLFAPNPERAAEEAAATGRASRTINIKGIKKF